ncbi:hypothetical protein Goshw_009002, partial [Gossypium schwendimanii]|nr:hypothetical protein [Gossypium schwendimanii]
AEDQILQCHIRNLPSPASLLIEPYLREVSFWHMALVGRGCKLDLKLVRALVERWKPETHTFYFPCGECIITLEDVHLQLGLPMDGSRSDRNSLLRRNFVTLDEDSTKRSERTQLGVYRVDDIVQGDVLGDTTRKNQNWWLHFTTAIMGAFEWTPYEDPAIQEVIPEEFLGNPNIWYMKVSLVVYITVEMHETDRILWQFRF